MNDFPQNTDILFKSKKLTSDSNIPTGINKFFYFSESYRKAAESLFAKIMQPDFETHFLITPTIYLCRHFLELRIKELISGINYSNTGTYTFPDGHNLDNLWNTYKSLLSNADSTIVPNPTDLANVEKLITEFNSIDSSSMSFRYPVEKDKKSETLNNLQSFDMENFIEVMEKLFNFFYEQSGNLFQLIEMADGYFSYLQSQMEINY